jgi:hypothetical protein
MADANHTAEPAVIYNGVDMTEISSLLKRVHELMCAGGLVRIKYGYSFNGWLPDGRAVKHKFELGGYERTGPTVAKERAKLGLPTPPTAEELIAQIEAEEAVCGDGGKCGIGGYCTECPTQLR